MPETDAIAARVRSATICGRRYRIQFDASLGKDYGECCYPSAGEPGLIRIRPDLEGLDLLDTFLHELLHAAFPELGEGRVTRGATDIARAMWRAGLRITP